MTGANVGSTVLRPLLGFDTCLMVHGHLSVVRLDVFVHKGGQT